MNKSDMYRKLSGDAYKMFHYLVEQINRCGGKFTHSDKCMERDLNFGNRKLMRAKSELLKYGLIAINTHFEYENNNVKKSTTEYMLPWATKKKKSKVQNAPKSKVQNAPVNNNNILLREEKIEPTPTLNGGGDSFKEEKPYKLPEIITINNL